MNFSLLHSRASSPLHTHPQATTPSSQLFFQHAGSHASTVPKRMSWHGGGGAAVPLPVLQIQAE